MNAGSVYEVIQRLSTDERMKFDRLPGVVAEMSAEEQAALDAEIEHSLDQVDAGRIVEADDLIARLRARSA